MIDSQLTSWESGDGLELDLTQKQYVDAKINSESRIKVKKASEKEPGKGLITTTDTKEFELKPKPSSRRAIRQSWSTRPQGRQPRYLDDL